MQTFFHPCSSRILGQLSSPNAFTSTFFQRETTIILQCCHDDTMVLLFRSVLDSTTTSRETISPRRHCRFLPRRCRDSPYWNIVAFNLGQYQMENSTMVLTEWHQNDMDLLWSYIPSPKDCQAYIIFLAHYSLVFTVYDSLQLSCIQS